MKIYTNKKLMNIISELVEADEFEKDFTWHYAFILHHIRTYPMIDSRFKNCDYIPINVKNLRNFISYNHAHKILRNLVTGGVIKTDGIYHTGIKSKFYKIEESYESKWQLSEVADKTMLKKFNTSKKSIFKLKGQSHVTDCMEKLTINKNTAFEYIKNAKLTPEQKNSYTMQVEMFDQKFYVVDSKGNRLHNNLTNLASPLRAHLIGSNGLLSQIDIKCSQPTFLALKTSKIETIDFEERQRLLKICEQGQFYEYLFDGCDIDLSNKKIRKEFKTKVFSELLFNKNVQKLTNIEKIFKSKFPSIFKFIVDSKSNNHKDFPVMLQKQESEFIFSVVSELEHLEIFTIHDSIITCRGCIEEVKQEMYRQFSKKYNFFPKLVVENLELS